MPASIPDFLTRLGLCPDLLQPLAFCQAGLRLPLQDRLEQRVVLMPASTCLQDEMKALQYINTGAFLVGYLGFLATFILDQIYTYFRVAGVVRPNNIVKHTLRAVSPHFNLARWAYCQVPGLFLWQLPVTACLSARLP